MKFFVKLLSISLILAFLCQETVWARQKVCYCLRPLATQEKNVEIDPNKPKRIYEIDGVKVLPYRDIVLQSIDHIHLRPASAVSRVASLIKEKLKINCSFYLHDPTDRTIDAWSSIRLGIALIMKGDYITIEARALQNLGAYEDEIIEGVLDLMVELLNDGPALEEISVEAYLTKVDELEKRYLVSINSPGIISHTDISPTAVLEVETQI
jgi:phosphotransferase system HPr-like phosphotransfer protein